MDELSLCKAGHHQFEPVLGIGKETGEVVCWCRVCGCVVIDQVLQDKKISRGRVRVPVVATDVWQCKRG